MAEKLICVMVVIISAQHHLHQDQDHQNISRWPGRWGRIRWEVVARKTARGREVTWGDSGSRAAREGDGDDDDGGGDDDDDDGDYDDDVNDQSCRQVLPELGGDP